MVNKQVTEVNFSQRHEKTLPTPIVFNSTNVLTSACQKPLSLVLDSKLGSNEHITQKIKQNNKIIGLMKRPSLILSWKQLLLICKTFPKILALLHRLKLA